MLQDFCQDTIFEGMANFRVVVAVFRISGNGYLTIGKTREEEITVFSGPLGEMGAEAFFRSTLSGKKDSGRNAGDFTSTEEHRRTEVIEGEPATGKPGEKCFDQWGHIFRRKGSQWEDHALTSTWGE